MLQKFNEWSTDASGLLNGTERLFENVEVHNDRIMNALNKLFEHNSTVQVILQVLFSSFAAHCSHLLQDHLTDGQYGLVSDNQTLQKETATVPSTNVISERDFAQFDWLLREKPNASLTSLENLIMFSNNKTSSWLSQKSVQEREDLLKIARSKASDLRKVYKLRSEEVLKQVI